MSKRPTYGNGKICYVEIPANDIAVSVAFYKAVFNWNIRQRGDGAMAFDDGVGEVSGSWVKGRPPMGEVGILIYMMVDDINDAIDKVIKAGGIIIQPVGGDPGETTARFTDPAGNIFGLYQEPTLQQS